MDDKTQYSLHRLQAEEIKEFTRFCPEDQEISEYFDGGLSGTGHQKLERHLADCRYCLARIGVLERLARAQTSLRVSGAALARARQMRPPAPRRWPGKAGAWASAAVVLLTLFAVASRGPEPAPESGANAGSATGTEATARQLRSLDRSTAELVVFAPVPNSEVNTGSSFEWSEVPGSLHYDVFVLSHAGDVLWNERMAGTEWVLDEPASLVIGSKFYVRVEASLEDGRIVRSKHVAYQHAERE
jgi:hypothetical protein